MYQFRPYIAGYLLHRLFNLKSRNLSVLPQDPTQARTETSEQKKRYENTIKKQNQQHQNLQSTLFELQNKHVTTQSTLEQQKISITKLTKQRDQTQADYQESSTTIAILKDRLAQAEKKPAKRKNRTKAALNP